MKIKLNRSYIYMVMVLLIIVVSLFSGCSLKSNSDTTINEESSTPSTTTSETKIVYSNTVFGFDFNLPLSWKGYTIVNGKWEGMSTSTATQSESLVAIGSIINIRHPLWTEKVPRQDIPIMVFTLAQWTSLQKDDFHIGAAPIGPSELARNSKYVFALPARYNYAFPKGYEEVETILKNNPIKATEKISVNSFEKYFNYLYMTRDELKTVLGSYTIIDEAGLEFNSAGIRVWFEGDKITEKSTSVFISNSDVDYNGLKRGDNINKFRETFGVPISDNTSSAEAIFVYKQVWLIVDYNPKTGETAAMYVSSPTNSNFINPVTESTPAKIMDSLGVTLNIPKDAQNVQYSIIDSGDGKKIAQAVFTKNGVTYTYRIRPTATSFEDISGAYFDWGITKNIKVSYNSGEVRYNKDEQGVILWYDIVPGLMYCIYADNNSTEQSLLEIANEVYVPEKDAQ